MLSLKSTRVHPLLDRLNSPPFDDVVICGCGGQGMETSRFMLGSLSPLLHSALVDVPPTLQTSIIVNDASEESVKHLFDFVIGAEINLNETDYHNLLELMLLMGIDYMDKCSLVAENSQDTVEIDTVESNAKLESDEISQDSVPKMESVGVMKEIEILEGRNHQIEMGAYEDSGDDMDKGKESDPEQPGVIHSCEYCDKCFSATEFLRKHIKASHGQGMLQCDKCDYSTNQKGRLTRHIANVHERSRKHQCDICWKLFSSATDMQRHKHAVHLKMRSFTCDFCGKAFSQKPHMVRHRRQHTGEKPFACGKCGQWFSQSDHQKLHEKSHRIPPHSH